MNGAGTCWYCNTVGTRKGVHCSTCGANAVTFQPVQLVAQPNMARPSLRSWYEGEDAVTWGQEQGAGKGWRVPAMWGQHGWFLGVDPLQAIAYNVDFDQWAAGGPQVVVYAEHDLVAEWYDEADDVYQRVDNYAEWMWRRDRNLAVAMRLPEGLGDLTMPWEFRGPAHPADREMWNVIPRS